MCIKTTHSVDEDNSWGKRVKGREGPLAGAAGAGLAAGAGEELQ